MKPLTVLFALILIFSTGLAGARGSARNSSGSHFGNGHWGGSQHGSAHLGGSHSRGGHFRAPRFNGRHFGRSHPGVDLLFAAPFFWYDPLWYDPYPYGYYPPVVVVPSAPPTYIEQGQAQSAPTQPSDWWYYCSESKTYYPYVRECPGGWQRVTPQPPPAQ